MIQWFAYTGTVGKKTILFPMAFATMHYSAMIVINEYTSSTDSIPQRALYLEHTDKTQVTHYIGSNRERRFIAVGY